MNPEIIIKSEKIKDNIAALPEAGPFGEKILANENGSAMAFRVITSEESSDKSEMHEDYNDLFVVIEGSEEIFIGGEMPDKEDKGSGEWLGGNLINSRKYEIKAGDIVIIPKSVPHQHGRGTIKMIVLKTN